MLQRIETQGERMLRKNRLRKLAIAILIVGLLIVGLADYATPKVAMIGLSLLLAVTFALALAAYLKSHEK